MSDGLDISGILGTVVIGGVAMKMVDTMYTPRQQQSQPRRNNMTKKQSKSGKQRQRRGTTSYGSSPW